MSRRDCSITFLLIVASIASAQLFKIPYAEYSTGTSETEGGGGQCNCLRWTKWINADTPSDTGDWETLGPPDERGRPGTLHHVRPDICTVPVRMECRTVDDKTPWYATKDKITYQCNPLGKGFSCQNRKQGGDGSNYDSEAGSDYKNSGYKCRDYEARVLCFDAVNYNCPCLYWTKWFNSDNPTTGYGDEELIGYSIPKYVCEGDFEPVDVQCKTVSGMDVFHAGNKKVQCDLRGLSCHNLDQGKNCKCHDYEVRFLCPKFPVDEYSEAGYEAKNTSYGTNKDLLGEHVLGRTYYGRPGYGGRPVYGGGGGGGVDYGGRTEYQGFGAEAEYTGEPTYGAAYSGGETGYRGGSEYGGTGYKGGIEYGGTGHRGGSEYRGSEYGGGGAGYDGAGYKGGAEYGQAGEYGGAEYGGNVVRYEGYKGGVGYEGGAEYGGAEYSGARYKGGAEYDGAGYRAEADYGRAGYEGGAEYRGAGYKAGAEYGVAGYREGAEYGGAGYKGGAEYGGAGYKGGAEYGGAGYKGGVEYGGAEYKGGAEYDGAGYKGGADYGGAGYKGGIEYSGSGYRGGSEYRGSEYGGGGAGYDGAEYKGGAGYDSATSGYRGGTEYKDRPAGAEYGTGSEYQSGKGYGSAGYEDGYGNDNYEPPIYNTKDEYAGAGPLDMDYSDSGNQYNEGSYTGPYSQGSGYVGSGHQKDGYGRYQSGSESGLQSSRYVSKREPYMAKQSYKEGVESAAIDYKANFVLEENTGQDSDSNYESSSYDSAAPVAEHSGSSPGYNNDPYSTNDQYDSNSEHNSNYNRE